MKKQFAWLISCLLILALLLTSCAGFDKKEQDQNEFYNLGVDTERLPLHVTEASLFDLSYGDLEKRIGLAGKNLESKDMTQLSIPFLAHLSYDTKTLWPSEKAKPRNFSPQTWLDEAKDPGLGIKKLHENNITGQGVQVAVVGSPTPLLDHQEFHDNFLYSYVRSDTEYDELLGFEGMVAASILAGKQCGVAKEAVVHYFSVTDSGPGFSYYCQAVKMVLESNQGLPKEEQIRLISISDGISEEDEGWLDWELCLEKAKEAEVDILYFNNAALNGFFWGGCPPYKDRNDPKNYRPAEVLSGIVIDKDAVLVPGDYRTTALPTGEDVYMYWGEGGFGWAIPYLSGLCALGWQVNSDLTLQEMLEMMKETAYISANGWKIINPPAFVEQAASK